MTDINPDLSSHVETVCLLSKLHEAKHHVNVRLDMDELDLTSAESKATYEEIKAYVAEHNDGMKVSNLYIAQVYPYRSLNLARLRKKFNFFNRFYYYSDSNIKVKSSEETPSPQPCPFFLQKQVNGYF